MAGEGCRKLLDENGFKDVKLEDIKCDVPEENCNCPVNDKCECYTDEMVEYMGG